MNQKVKINSIIVRGEIQQRKQLDEECIKEYVEAIADGADFPPVDVYDDGESLFLADGFHRVEAYRQTGIATVAVTIHKGTKRDAILHAVGANATHGLRRTNDDKRKAVLTLLNDSEWGQWSDTAIAKRIGVTQPFVSKVRRNRTQNGFECGTVRKCSDGRLVDTSNIGAKRQTEEPEESSTAGASWSLQSLAEMISIDENEEAQSAGVNDVESSPDPDSDDATGTDDESSDQTEEGNIESDDDDVDGADEATSADNNEEEPILATSPEEHADRQEDEEPEPDSNDPSSEEATENAGEDNNPVELEADDSQVPSTEVPEANEVQTLRAEIIELERVIIEKDDRITELETENAELRRRIQEYEDQKVSKDVVDLIEGFELAEESSGSSLY